MQCVSGYVAIKSAVRCQEAASELSRTWMSSVSIDGFPKGCMSNTDHVYFNKHPTGSARKGLSVICSFAAQCSMALPIAGKSLGTDARENFVPSIEECNDRCLHM